MAQVKRSEKVQSDRVARLSELRNRRADVMSFGAAKESSFWISLKRMLTSYADMEKRREEIAVVDACDPDSDPRKIKENLRVYRERRGCYESVIDLVEKADDNVQHLDITIKKIEDEHREAAKELA